MLRIAILTAVITAGCIYLANSDLGLERNSAHLELEVPPGVQMLEVKLTVEGDHLAQTGYLDCWVTRCVGLSTCLKEHLRRPASLADRTTLVWAVDVHNAREVTCDPWVDADDEIDVGWRWTG